MVTVLPADVLLLADLYRAEWPAARERIRLSGHPTNEGDDDAADDDAKDDAEDKTGDGGDDDKSGKGKGDDGAADDKVKPEDEWRTKSRKNETRAKKAERERDELKAKLDGIAASNMSDQEKAIKTAREEAKAEAMTAAEKDRRTDKLELAVTRIGVGSGVTIGEGDKAKTVKFADPEDVQARLEREIADGTIDGEDIYKDGKVDKAALTAWLTELAVAKPRWLADAPNGNGAAAAGDVDAGKGSARKTPDMNDLIRGRRG
jgi:hypothetical protein